MSFAVVRGSPNASQLYFDTFLDNLIKSGLSNARKHEDINIAEVLFYGLRQKPNETFVINALSGETYTKRQILEWSVSAARALKSKCVKNTVAFMMRNHRHLVVLYYGVIFAGVVPLFLELNSTVSEIVHFLKLVDPAFVFCDADRLDLATAAVKAAGVGSEVIHANAAQLEQFIADASDDVDSFQVIKATPDDAVLMLPTSGSTGLPKSAILNHRGLLAQVPSMWMFHSFPMSPQRMLLTSSAQWATHTMAMMTAPVYQAQLVVIPNNTSVEDIIMAMKNFRPTWSLLAPAMATSVGNIAKPEHLASLQIMFVTGAPFAANPEAKLRSLLPSTAHLCIGIGMTETQGFYAIPDRDDPRGSYGKVLNIMEYKLVDDAGNSTTRGELLIRSRCVLSGYHGNEAATREAFTDDGWLRTGDLHSVDTDGNLVFQERIKFCFKFNSQQTAPEELERVLGAVPGVSGVAVAPAPLGPAALLLLDEEATVSREMVHEIMKENFNENKQLRGGIAFVSSLPYNANGKLHRRQCQNLLNELIARGDCH